MGSSAEQRLLDAIERNKVWIEKKCKFSENDPVKRQDLYQDIMVQLHLSKDSFAQKDIDSSDAWVKRVASNATAKYIRNELKHKYRPLGKISDPIDTHAREQARIELKDIIDYVNYEFSSRDREIFHSMMMKDKHSEIAIIVGMTPESVTNRISFLRDRLKKHFNRGDHE